MEDDGACPPPPPASSKQQAAAVGGGFLAAAPPLSVGNMDCEKGARNEHAAETDEHVVVLRCVCLCVSARAWYRILSGAPPSPLMSAGRQPKKTKDEI